MENIPTEKIGAFLNLVCDTVRDGEKAAEAPENIKVLLAAYVIFVKQCVQLNLSQKDIQSDLLTLRLSEDRANFISSFVRERIPSLRLLELDGISENSTRHLVDFDWKLHLQLGGDTKTHSREPLVLLALNLKDSSSSSRPSSEVVLELDKASADLLLHSLNSALANISQL